MSYLTVFNHLMAYEWNSSCGVIFMRSFSASLCQKLILCKCKHETRKPGQVTLGSRCCCGGQLICALSRRRVGDDDDDVDGSWYYLVYSSCMRRSDLGLWIISHLNLRTGWRVPNFPTLVLMSWSIGTGARLCTVITGIKNAHQNLGSSFMHRRKTRTYFSGLLHLIHMKEDYVSPLYRLH